MKTDEILCHYKTYILGMVRIEVEKEGSKGWSNNTASIAERSLVLILSTPYSSQALPGMTPEYRIRRKL